MKRRSFLPFCLLLAACIAAGVAAGCSGKQYYTYVRWTPVYMPMSQFRKPVKAEAATDLKQPGKIYVKGNYLFINEVDKGIHIYDNSNPWQPKNLSYITIPGNGDIAVKGNILYADSYIDLLVIDITDPQNARELKRVQGIFPNSLNQHNIWIDTTQGIPIAWKQDTVREEIVGGVNPVSPVVRDVLTGGSSGGSSSGGEGSSGRGGSTARMTIYDTYLYAVSSSDLQIFRINNPASPAVWAKMNLGWNIETIFPYKDKLFIGSQTGMFIYDNSNPLNPVQLCQFRHARSCDPVVTDGNFAYVTLRSGSACGGASNQLDVVDIADIVNPKLVKSYAMQEPFGLDIDNGTLLLCDGIAGLKVLDVKNPANAQFIAQVNDFRTFDVIAIGGHAIITGPDGIYQYDYSNLADIKMISKITVVK